MENDESLRSRFVTDLGKRFPVDDRGSNSSGFCLKHHTLCGSVVIKHAKGVIMIADILTKAQARPIFLQLLKLLDDYSKNAIIELTN